jgi:integrase
MCVYKQGEIWWYEFYVEGKRYRSSTLTTDKTTAQKIEVEHRESIAHTGVRVSPTLNAIKVAQGEARRASRWEGIETQVDPPRSSRRHAEREGLTPKTLLAEAGAIFLNRQKELCRPKTVECNQGHLNRLVEFFGNIPLVQFTIAHFEHYQSSRGTRCGASSVNHELNTLSRILKRVDLWYPIKRNYTPLKEQDGKPPRIFTGIEQERIFRALGSNPDLELANIAFTITRNTTASGCELRGLRLKHLELEADPPRIHIPQDATKNNVRPRTIPLNSDALSALHRAVERARRLGSHYPDDYLFPLRIDRATWNPKKPASKSWLRKQVEYLRELTGIDHINPHTFRHLAVTELLEQGAPEQTVVSLAGWVGRRMFEIYSHPRLEAKAEAVELLGKSGHKAPDLHPPVPDIMHPAIQAEIARQVELALQSRLGAPRTPERRSAGRRRMHGRRIARGPISLNQGLKPETPAGRQPSYDHYR